MDEWILVNGTYQGGIEPLGIHRYLIPVWYQSLGIRLPKVVFSWVGGWSTGPPGSGASQLVLILVEFCTNFMPCQDNL